MENPSQLSNRDGILPQDTFAAIHLMELFREPDRDIDAIVEFISRDARLTAETLKRCNNASFSGAERTTDIFEAVSRLGFYELYGIIAAKLGAHATLAGPPAATEPGMIQDGAGPTEEEW